MSANNSSTDNAPHRPSVVRVLRRTLAQGWGCLGLVVAVSVMWVMLHGLPLGLLGLRDGGGVPPAVVAGAFGVIFLLMGAGANAVLFFVANRIAHGEAEAGDILIALRRRFLPSLGLLAFMGAGMALAAVNAAFWLVGTGGGLRMIGMVWVYLGAMFALAMLYAYPLLMEQGGRPLTAARRSALLFFDNPAYTVGLAASLMAAGAATAAPALAGVRVLTALPVIVFYFIAAGAAALAANNAALDLLAKYEGLER